MPYIVLPDIKGLSTFHFSEARAHVFTAVCSVFLWLHLKSGFAFEIVMCGRFVESNVTVHTGLIISLLHVEDCP